VGGGETARVFAVTHRANLDDAKDPAAFAGSFRRHADALRDCQADGTPTVIVFPEDSGLVAWFIGRQGLLGRNASDSHAAFNALYAQANRPADAYRRRFPGISDARALTLALSDRAWRAMDTTFGGIARDTNAWVVASANLPHAEAKNDPDYRDPDASGPAFVATGPEVFNTALVYSPTGARVGQVDKAFLTDPEEQTLELTNGSLETLPIVQLPFAKLGIATSRDAFYAPFAQRLDDLGAELVVQPEAFSQWTQGDLTRDEWLPDVMLAAGWSLTQKYTSVRHVAAPMLTGNLFELTFDGQAFITAKADPARTRLGFEGSAPEPGFEAIGPWAFADPFTTDDLKTHRDWAREEGKRLLPGSHDPDEGRTFDGVLGAALRFDGAGQHAATAELPTASVEVAPSASAHQRNPAIAYDADGTAYVAWSDARAGREQIWVSRSTDDGASWSAAIAVEPSGGRQLRPAIAAGAPGFVAIAWQDDARGSEQIRWAVSRDQAQSFVPGWAERSARAQWEPAIVTLDDSGWAIAWTDFRNGAAPHVRVACYSVAEPVTPGSRAIDDSTFGADRLAGSQLQPTLARFENGLLFAAWIDYRKRDWRVLTRAGRLCTESGDSLELTADSPTEVLASDPSAVIAANGELMLTWDEIRKRRGHHDIAAAKLSRGVWQSLDGPPSAAWSRFRPVPYFLAGFKAAVQDMAPGKNGLSVWNFRDEPLRVDDSLGTPNQLTRPRVATRRDGKAALMVFEDDRDGWVRIRAQALP
jgi:predicted amidohydrolase